MNEKVFRVKKIAHFSLLFPGMPPVFTFVWCQLCVFVQLSYVWLSAAPRTGACLALCAWISRQEYWSGLPFLPRGDLPNPGIEPASPESPALAGRFFATETPGGIYFISYKNSAHEGKYLVDSTVTPGVRFLYEDLLTQCPTDTSPDPVWCSVASSAPSLLSSPLDIVSLTIYLSESHCHFLLRVGITSKPPVYPQLLAKWLT